MIQTALTITMKLKLPAPGSAEMVDRPKAAPNPANTDPTATATTLPPRMAGQSM